MTAELSFEEPRDPNSWITFGTGLRVGKSCPAKLEPVIPQIPQPATSHAVTGAAEYCGQPRTLWRAIFGLADPKAG